MRWAAVSSGALDVARCIVRVPRDVRSDTEARADPTGERTSRHRVWNVCVCGRREIRRVTTRRPTHTRDRQHVIYAIVSTQAYSRTSRRSTVPRATYD